MTATTPQSVSPVGTPMLQETLEQVLSGYFKRPRSVRGLERRVSPYSSSYRLEELDVTMDNGERLALLFKDLSPNAVPPHARWIKPTFVVHPEREIAAYRAVLRRTTLGTAVCYGGVVSAPEKQYWLFLERVPGVPLWQIGDPAVWEDAARWLARLHARTRYPEGPWLRYGAAYYRRWLRRLIQVVRRKNPDALETLRELVQGYGRLVEQLVRLPTAFIHGEFYPSNVLVRREATSVRICPIDWEMAAVGPALMDLGALTCGSWTREEQVAMVAAYRDALVEIQGRAPAMEALLSGLDTCQLFQAMQWVGWSLCWDPPEEHTRDWLREAFTLAERVLN